MLVSVIVPAHNAAATLPRALVAIAAQQFDGEVEVVVVDDGSTDDTARIATDAGANVIRNPRPLGPGRARNQGVAAASGSALAFTDSDCAPAPGWLAAGVGALERAELVQGRVEPDPGVDRGPLDRTLWVTSDAGLYQSANLFVRRDVFDAVGGFGDGLLERARAHFGEDVEFGWRARRAGARACFCEEALVHHAVLGRGPGGFMRERRRDGLFPMLTREVPELREEFLYRHSFLTRRSASFAVAAVGAVVAATARAPWVAAIALAPYARAVAGDALEAGPRVALIRAAADAVGFVSLVRGSVEARTLVL